jgi:hypothetical protein
MKLMTALTLKYAGCNTVGQNLSFRSLFNIILTYPKQKEALYSSLLSSDLQGPLHHTLEHNLAFTNRWKGSLREHSTACVRRLPHYSYNTPREASTCRCQWYCPTTFWMPANPQSYSLQHLPISSTGHVQLILQHSDPHLEQKLTAMCNNGGTRTSNTALTSCEGR